MPLATLPPDPPPENQIRVKHRAPILDGHGRVLALWNLPPGNRPLFVPAATGHKTFKYLPAPRMDSYTHYAPMPEPKSFDIYHLFEFGPYQIWGIVFTDEHPDIRDLFGSGSLFMDPEEPENATAEALETVLKDPYLHHIFKASFIDGHLQSYLSALKRGE